MNTDEVPTNSRKQELHSPLGASSICRMLTEPGAGRSNKPRSSIPFRGESAGLTIGLIHGSTLSLISGQVSEYW